MTGFGADGFYTDVGIIVGEVGANSTGRITGATFGQVVGVGWRGTTIGLGAITFYGKGA